MYLRTILIVLVLGALGLFTAVNWHAFTTPTTLSWIVGTIEAPLGLLLIGAAVLLTVMFLTYVVYLQSSVILETRRHERDLYGHRALAEHAESSRIPDLRASLETRIDAIAQRHDAAVAQVLARLDQMDGDLRQAVEQCQNSLAAAMEEIDDRLASGLGESYPRRRAS